VYLHFLGWPPLPHSSCPQQRPFLLLPRPKRSASQRHTNTRQRPGLLLLRRLPFRLRSQHRPGSSHPRRRPRRCKTQSRGPSPTSPKLSCSRSTSGSTNTLNVGEVCGEKQMLRCARHDKHGSEPGREISPVGRNDGRVADGAKSWAKAQPPQSQGRASSRWTSPGDTRGARSRWLAERW